MLQIETVGYDENGTEDIFPSCDDPNYLCGVSQNDAVEQSTPAIVSTRGVFGASFVASLTINENSCGVSDEGIVDNDNDNVTVAGRGCQMTTTTQLVDALIAFQNKNFSGNNILTVTLCFFLFLVFLDFFYCFLYFFVCK